MVIEKKQYQKLLNEFYIDSRTTLVSLEDVIGLTRQTISKMKTQLWENGILVGPAIILNPIVLDLTQYFMEIKTNPSEPEILNRIKKIREVQMIDGILGNYSLIVKFQVPSKNRFSAILKKIDSEIAESRFQSYKLIEIIEPFKIGGFIIKKMVKDQAISTKDQRILHILEKNHNYRKWELKEDSRLKLTQNEIKRIDDINLSRKIKKYKKREYIQNFTTRLDFQALKDKNLSKDFHAKYYVRIKPKKIGHYNSLANQLVHEKNIFELYRTGEDSGLLAIVRANGLEGFNTFIKNLYQNYDILNTHTTVSVESHLPEIGPPTLNAAKKVCNPLE